MAEGREESSHGANSATESLPPTISLTFLSPSEDGEPREETNVISGDKNLRKFMLEKKLKLYGNWGTMMNCGGGGNCGTCIVQIKEGAELLSGRTEVEEKKLQKNPGDWRLACQTIVGDKSNSGKVVVQRLPQQLKQ